MGPSLQRKLCVPTLDLHQDGCNFFGGAVLREQCWEARPSLWSGNGYGLLAGPWHAEQQASWCDWCPMHLCQPLDVYGLMVVQIKLKSVSVMLLQWRTDLVVFSSQHGLSHPICPSSPCCEYNSLGLKILLQLNVQQRENGWHFSKHRLHPCCYCLQVLDFLFSRSNLIINHQLADIQNPKQCDDLFPIRY